MELGILFPQYSSQLIKMRIYLRDYCIFKNLHLFAGADLDVGNTAVNVCTLSVCHWSKVVTKQGQPDSGEDRQQREQGWKVNFLLRESLTFPHCSANSASTCWCTRQRCPLVFFPLLALASTQLWKPEVTVPEGELSAPEEQHWPAPASGTQGAAVLQRSADQSRPYPNFPYIEFPRNNQGRFWIWKRVSYHAKSKPTILENLY